MLYAIYNERISFHKRIFMEQKINSFCNTNVKYTRSSSAFMYKQVNISSDCLEILKRILQP